MDGEDERDDMTRALRTTTPIKNECCRGFPGFVPLTNARGYVTVRMLCVFHKVSENARSLVSHQLDLVQKKSKMQACAVRAIYRERERERERETLRYHCAAHKGERETLRYHCAAHKGESDRDINQ